MTWALSKHLLSLEARKLMSYRGDFWLTAVASIVTAFLLHWFLWDAIFDRSGSEQLGGFTLGTMMTYLIGVNLIGRVVRGSDLQMGIATEIYDGGLSRYLLYPTRYLPFKYVQHIGSILPEIAQVVLFGGILVAIFGLPEGSGVTLGSVARTLPLLCIGNLLYFLMSTPLQLLAFWADNVWSLGVMLRFVATFLGGAMLPLSIFPGWAESSLRFLPFVQCFGLPVRVMMGRASTEEALFGAAIALAWCVVIGMVSRLIWRRGQTTYTGVGI